MPATSVTVYSQLPLFRTPSGPRESVIKGEFMSVKRLYSIFARDLASVRIIVFSVFPFFFT